MTKLNVGLLNDSRVAGHFGCDRVMACITHHLTERNAEISYSVPSAHDWRNDAEAVRALAETDLIVVNGEGTLHHGRQKGRWLLDLADHPDLGRPVKSVVNMLWQDNPDDWSAMLARFDHVQSRDRQSAEDAGQAIGRAVEWFADFSVCLPTGIEPVSRNGIVVGGSVSNSAALALAKLCVDLQAVRPETCYVPITKDQPVETPRKVSARLKAWIAARRYRRFVGAALHKEYLPDAQSYLQRLAAAELSVTGRFHSVCLALCTGTPFVAVTSNSWKIEALVRDAGLDPRRVISRKDLSVNYILDQDWSFSQAEQDGIDAYLAKARTGVSKLFDQIVEDAQNKAKRRASR